MTDTAIMPFGGIIGAIFGLLWSDPYRDQRGRYKTHRQSRGNWLFQGAMGGIIGAIVTPSLFIATVSNPLIGPLVFFIVTFIFYRKFVDPR